MALRITIEKPPTSPDARRVVVSPGTTVELQAVDDANPNPAGEWKRKSHDRADAMPDTAHATATGSLKFVMDKSGSHEGTYYFEGGGQATDEVKVDRRWSLREQLLPGALLFTAGAVAYAAIIWLIIFLISDTDITARAYAFAAATILFALFLIWLAARAASDQRGLAGLVQGADRRTSTSKVQYLLWTFGVAFALAYIGGRALIGRDGSFTCDPETEPSDWANCVPVENWEMYLILLGVPAAAAVVAKGVVSYQVTNGLVQKTEATGATAADVITDDNGRADLADIQYLIFNVITFVFVAVTFIRTGTLTAVPEILLGLTSAAAATYVLNKALQTNKPIITSVTPSVISPGTPITVQGKNLFPPGGDGTLIVKVGGVPAGQVRRLAGDTVVVVAPPGMSEEDQTVRAITAARIETEPYPISVVGGLNIIGFMTQAPKPGDLGTIRVDGLPPDPNSVLVVFDSIMAQGATTPDGNIAASVPLGLTAGSEVEVSVEVDGRWSTAKTLTLGK
jgi:IPT/TIG domain